MNTLGPAPFPERLTRGYRAFAQERLLEQQSRYRSLADQGQSPDIMVIGCCDSRVSPSLIFDTGPGELFVVRNVANLVPPYAPDEAYHGVSAALEFAVQALKVKHIVVLGHAGCGGVRAFVDEGEPLSPGDFIGKWISMLEPASASIGPRQADETLAHYVTRLEQASLQQSITHLMTFPFVRRRVEAGSLALHAAYFGVATGALLIVDPATGAFTPVGAAGPVSA
jgi:carbonic anhydrase